MMSRPTTKYQYATKRERLLSESYLYARDGHMWWSKFVYDEARTL